MTTAFYRLGAALALTVMPLTAQAADKPKPKPYDPDEKICEKVEVLGTRIATKRICATRAEWEERRRMEREVVDDAQRRVNGPCSTVNTHSGAPAC